MATELPPESGSGRAIAVGVVLSDRYELKELLGSGGTGSVFLAHDRELHIDVAIKILDSVLAQDTTSTERFRDEVAGTQLLQHEHIRRVYGHHTTEEGVPYIVQELLQGRTLREELDERGPLSSVQIREILHGVASALAHSHSRGLIHRDVSPRNIFLTTDGGIKLIDFGIARPATDSTGTAAIGTLRYAAPEQLAGQPRTQSDIYSLARVAIEMATGELPSFHGQLSSIAGDLRQLIRRCVHPDPTRRPEAAEFLAALLPRSKRQKRWRAVRNGLAITVLVIGAFLTTIRYTDRGLVGATEILRRTVAPNGELVIPPGVTAITFRRGVAKAAARLGRAELMRTYLPDEYRIEEYIEDAVLGGEATLAVLHDSNPQAFSQHIFRTDELLGAAILSNRLDSLRYLLSHGADPTVAMSQGTLFKVIRGGRLDLVEKFGRYFIRHPAAPIDNPPLLFFVALMGTHQDSTREQRLELLRAVVRGIGSPNATNRGGRTSLHYALLHHTYSLGPLNGEPAPSYLNLTLDLLSMPGIRADLRDVLGMTALHGWVNTSPDAYSDGDLRQLLPHLLKAGALVNEQTLLGETALALALRSGRTAAVDELLRVEGIDVNLADKDGNTPLHKLFQAPAAVRLQIASALLSAGARRDLKNLGGQTPLELALQAHCDELLPLLAE